MCVFVNASSEFIKESISYFKDPLLQFHGDETNQFCSSFKKDFWKVIHVKSIESINRIEEYPDASAILFENYKKDQFGGTGESFDWDIVKKANLSKKIVLSGGINVKNVDNAISTQPWCIDINSGVESSIGIKNITLVNKILEKF